MPNYPQSLALALVVAVLVFSIAVPLIGLDRPYPGDEQHFIRTSQQFGRGHKCDDVWV